MALQQDEKNKTAVMAFGRMNPPTTGHEKLINKTHEVAKQHGGTAHVVASHSHDKDKNPLPQDKKLGYLRKVAHPDVKVSGSSKEHPSLLHHASKLHAAGHNHLVYVAGEDRHKETHNLLHKYNGKTGKHGHYNFKSIKTVSSGKRDPDSHGTEGVSGSKMRDHARAGRHKEFKQGLPKALHPHAKEIHGHVGGTQLESFKEATMMKKKFKPSGKKTEVAVHAMPTANPAGYRSGSTKGAPSNTTRAGGTRFGENTNYMKMVNAEFEQFIGGQLNEVLSRQARIKRALMLRRYKHKIQRRKQIMRKKLATKEMLHRRARRHAVKLVRKRFMGKKGENYANLGMADKILIDKRVATKKKIIDRIAGRLLPKVRRAELVRLRDYKKNQKTKKKPSLAFKSAGASKANVTSRSNITRSPRPLNTYTTPGAVKQTATRSYTMPQRVKSEEYIVTEDNVIEIVDMLNTLTEKDIKALEKKMEKSDIDSDILFEVFIIGLQSEGDQTPQQKAFMSLNTFIAEDYNTPAATEVPDKKHPYQAAITDLALNTRNRNSAIKNYNYGPLNEDDSEYWEKVADLWDTSTEVAKESRCHNCAAFDRKPDTLKKIAEVMGPDGKKVTEKAHLGYCELFHFKCAGARVCDAWIGGGPITEEHRDLTSLDNYLKEFKASGEDSSIEDPIDPKTVTHDIIDKDNEKKKKQKKKDINKKFEALEWPHETAKKYKKDTPGQNEETDIEDDDEVAIKKIIKGLKKSVKGHDKQQKKLTKLLKKDQQNEELQTDSEVKKRENERIQGVVKNVRKKQYNLNRRVKRAVSKLPHMQTKVGGVQKEDAADVARVMRNQEGERDRIRQAYEREMERLNNNDEKKRLKDNHERRLQGLKARQKQARDTARARL